MLDIIKTGTTSTPTEQVSTVLQHLLQGPQKRSEVYTLSEVSAHCRYDDCWIVICDGVYDVTAFLEEHPGGRDILMEHAGRDATVAFYGAGHHPRTMGLLEAYCIGALAEHERVNLMGSLAPKRNSQNLMVN